MAKQFKEEGNGEFRVGKLSEARRLYEKALDFASEERGEEMA